jgi:hypothetical protein
LRLNGCGLSVEFARSQPQLRRPLLRTRAVVVAVADKDALRDRVAFNCRFFKPPPKSTENGLFLASVTMPFERIALFDRTIRTDDLYVQQLV